MTVTELVTPGDVTPEMLLNLMEDAYFSAKLEENEVLLDERFKVWVTPTPGGKRIRVASYFGIRTDVPIDERIAYANLVNDKLTTIRAGISLQNPETLVFDWYIPVDGGTPRRTIVFAIKLFIDLIDAAAKLDADNIIQ